MAEVHHRLEHGWQYGWYYGYYGYYGIIDMDYEWNGLEYGWYYMDGIMVIIQLG